MKKLNVIQEVKTAIFILAMALVVLPFSRQQAFAQLQPGDLGNEVIGPDPAQTGETAMPDENDVDIFEPAEPVNETAPATPAFSEFKESEANPSIDLNAGNVTVLEPEFTTINRAKEEPQPSAVIQVQHINVNPASEGVGENQDLGTGEGE
ncbi:MAG: hypothetical protein PHY94_04385 [Candidatus Omnitrophica bacterium]|nr:hypothetical protein [Candidatus Omnitrophota bacterium]